MHEHNGCNHQLKYCEVCDVVYCPKCKKEWGQKWTFLQPSYPSTNPIYQPNVWCGGNGVISDTAGSITITCNGHS